MSKKFKRLLEIVCIGSFLLAVTGCENADGSLNAAWTLPLLSVTGITGLCLKVSETKSNSNHE